MHDTEYSLTLWGREALSFFTDGEPRHRKMKAPVLPTLMHALNFNYMNSPIEIKYICKCVQRWGLRDLECGWLMEVGETLPLMRKELDVLIHKNTE